MSKRQPLVNGQYYHVFNRGQDHRLTFSNKYEFRRAISAVEYYRYSNPLSLSKFLALGSQDRGIILAQQAAKQPLVSIVAYCLMPTHFHFLLRQEVEGGISNYISQVQNSHTRFFNTRHERQGTLFLNRFKSVRIETQIQLNHVSRYIHLNPYSSHIVSSLAETEQYPWSSFSQYMGYSGRVCISPEAVLSSFSSRSAYQAYVFDRADYNRCLKQLEHTMLGYSESQTPTRAGR